MEPFFELPQPLKVVVSLARAPHRDAELVPDRHGRGSPDPGERSYSEPEALVALPARPEHSLRERESHDPRRGRVEIAHQVDLDFRLLSRAPEGNEGDDLSVLPNQANRRSL